METGKIEEYLRDLRALAIFERAKELMQEPENAETPEDLEEHVLKDGTRRTTLKVSSAVRIAVEELRTIRKIIDSVPHPQP